MRTNIEDHHMELEVGAFAVTVQLLLKALGLLTKRIGASVFACVHFLPFGLFCVNKCLSFKHVH